jgi:adenosylmethionine-8-amino-7-oxononanoate aminotransferase
MKHDIAAPLTSMEEPAWQREGAAHLWHPYTQMQTAPAPLPIARARGAYLYTADGGKILDGISSWWVNIHGHSHPYLNAALARQADEVEHVMFAGFTHRPAAVLAARLVDVLPPGLTRIFYSDNGSTAVEVALKMALQFWSNQGHAQRNRFITLDHAYHGDTVGAMSASAASAFTAPFAPFLFSVARAHSPYCFRCPVGLEPSTCRIDCLDSIEQLLEEHGDTVAGVLLEPMLQGAGGMIVWPAEFLRRVRQLCDQHGTLLLADEVLTGFGRTGKMFACEHAGIAPDIICLSKGLTAGYMPMGVTACTEHIYEAFLSDDRRKTFFHGHSFTANPLACAVAIASLDLFATEGSLARVQRLETIFRSQIARFAKLDKVGDVRMIGGVFVLELLNDDGSKCTEGYLELRGPQLTREFLRRGLLLRPLGDVLYFMPPFCITEDEVRWAMDQMEDVLLQPRL